MRQADVATGVRISNRSGEFTGTISRVSWGTTFWRRRSVIRAFWVCWDHDIPGAEAHMLPGDEEYLVRLDSCT